MAKAKQGAWAEYTMTMPGAPQKMKVRYAVVEKNERELTMETDSQTPMGPVHSSMTFAPSPPDAWKLVKARMQMGTQPAQDVPAAKLDRGQRQEVGRRRASSSAPRRSRCRRARSRPSTTSTRCRRKRAA